MTNFVKFIICFVISVVAYGLARFALTHLFDMSNLLSGALSGVVAATVFFIAARLLGIAAFRPNNKK